MSESSPADTYQSKSLANHSSTSKFFAIFDNPLRLKHLVLNKSEFAKLATSLLSQSVTGHHSIQNRKTLYRHYVKEITIEELPKPIAQKGWRGGLDLFDKTNLPAINVMASTRLTNPVPASALSDSIFPFLHAFHFLPTFLEHPTMFIIAENKTNLVGRLESLHPVCRIFRALLARASDKIAVESGVD